ncbi:MAG: glycoside hydrolase family 20 zincin-like fold domain-containing protein, partial [Acidobacteriaceae bacterium]
MSRVAIFLLLALTSFSTFAWGSAVHNPLLPRPQTIQYGTGQISLRALAIEFSHAPNAEDRFAAEQLSQAIQARTGIRLSISVGRASANTIVLDRTGEASPVPLPDEKPGPNSREAYDLAIGVTGIRIRARSSAGIFYGVQTLAQLVEGNGNQAAFPAVTIRDWPSLAYRGTLVDISHGPLPTENELKRQLDFLARWKDNQYYLYSEASIQLMGYPLLNPDGRMSRDEVKRIIAYGRERHIDVILFCDLYGHMHDLFRIEKYSDLSDLPHGSEFDPRNPKVIALLTDWIGQLSQLFPSKFVAIGFDETFQSDMTGSPRPNPVSRNELYIRQMTTVT